MGWVFWVFGQFNSSFQDSWATIWDLGYTLTTILVRFCQILGCN